MRRQPIALALAIMSGPAWIASTAANAAEGTSKPLELSDKGVPYSRLEGTWKLVEVDGTPVPEAGKRWPGAFIVRFEAGQVTGMNACNGFFGPYRVVHSHLQTALGVTTSACESPVPDKWDEASMAAVSGGHIEISANGAKLKLSAAGARAYVFRRQ